MKAKKYPKKDKANKRPNKKSKNKKNNKKENIENNKSSIETIDNNKIEDIISNKKNDHDISNEEAKVFINAFHSYDLKEYEDKINIVNDDNNNRQIYDTKFFISNLNSKNKNLEISKENNKVKIDDKININPIFESKNNYLIPPIGELNDKLVQIFEDHLIYNGMKYNLTTRIRDIKKEFQNKKNIKYILVNTDEKTSITEKVLENFVIHK